MGPIHIVSSIRDIPYPPSPPPPHPHPPETTLPIVYMKFDICQPSLGQARLNIQQNGRRQEIIAVTFVFILFSLTAVLSVALDIFMKLLLEMEINEEMLIDQAALRRN